MNHSCHSHYLPIYHYHHPDSWGYYYGNCEYDPDIYYELPQWHIPIKGTIDLNCSNQKENFPYDFPFPWPLTVEIKNRGDCPAQVWIYYSNGFLKEREGRIIQPGEFHEFDRVGSVLAVSITCLAIGSNCPSCNPTGGIGHCLVDYNIY